LPPPSLPPSQNGGSGEGGALSGVLAVCAGAGVCVAAALGSYALRRRDAAAGTTTSSLGQRAASTLEDIQSGWELNDAAKAAAELDAAASADDSGPRT